jgi:hypothetical protein
MVFLKVRTVVIIGVMTAESSCLDRRYTVPMLTVPPYPRRLSLLTLLYGIFALVWLSAEDSVWLVTVLGFLLSLLSAAHAIFRLSGRRFDARLWIPAAAIVGALVGAGTVVATVVLMLLKTSVHSHLFPDYPFPLISGIVERLLPWIAAGALAGLALALLVYELSGGSS